MRRSISRCTTKPLWATASSKTVFTIAHTSRWPRTPLTNCPVWYRNRCCAHSAALTFRGRSSHKSPMPIGNSNGKALGKRPGERILDGSLATVGQPYRSSLASADTSASASPPSGPASKQPLVNESTGARSATMLSSKTKSSSRRSSAGASSPDSIAALPNTPRLESQAASSPTVTSPSTEGADLCTSARIILNKCSAVSPRLSAPPPVAAPSPPASDNHQRPTALPRSMLDSSNHLQNTSSRTTSKPSVSPSSAPDTGTPAAIKLSSVSRSAPNSPTMSASAQTSNRPGSKNWCIGPRAEPGRHSPRRIKSCNARDSRPQRTSRPSMTRPRP